MKYRNLSDFQQEATCTPVREVDKGVITLTSDVGQWGYMSSIIDNIPGHFLIQVKYK